MSRQPTRRLGHRRAAKVVVRARILIALVIAGTASVSVAAGCSGSPALRTDVTGEQLAEELDATVPNWATEHHIEGVTIAVVRNGDVDLLRSYGTSTALTPLSDDTVFEAASLGKPVFGHLVTSLADDGLLDLDASLATYAPELFIDGDPSSRSITARMILSHTSGLPEVGGTDPVVPTSEPGTEFRYSGSAYRLLQLVVQDLTGRTLNDLSRQYVFEPAGMSSSGFVWNDDYAERLAVGHLDDGTALEPTRTSEAHAASSLYTTPADYAAFVAYSMRRSGDGGARSGGPTTDLMVEPVIKISDEISWGMGWGLQATDPHPSFWHWGSNPGYRSYVVGYPEEQLAVVVLSNSEGMFRIVDDIIDVAIGGALPSYDWF